jgi:methionyl-tRNA formyltransferase
MFVIFGDEYGFPQLLKHVPNWAIKCIVAASIRPQSFHVAEETARFLGVPFLVQPRISDVGYKEFIRKINSLDPDYFIVNSYSMKLHRDILSLPKKAAINIHGALLPRYRGANPIQWALIHDEIMTGVTMHYMTDEFDAGDIISQRQIPIYFLDTWLEILARLAWATEELLHDEIPKLFQGTCERIPQDPSLARKWPRRKPEDGRIDWSKSVLSIYNLIRALVKPLPGAFFDKGGERIVLDTFRTIGEVTVLKHQLGLSSSRCRFHIPVAVRCGALSRRFR